MQVRVRKFIGLGVGVSKNMQKEDAKGRKSKKKGTKVS